MESGGDNIDCTDWGDEEIMMGSTRDHRCATSDDMDISNQNTLKLLIRQLKLNIVELKVAQKLQNTNLLLHVDQLKKKYSALKLEVDNLKSEKTIKKTDSYQQTDNSTKLNDTTVISKSVQVDNLNTYSSNNNDSIMETTADSRSTENNLTAEQQSAENNLQTTSSDINISDENETVPSSSTVSNSVSTGLPKIVSVTGGSENNTNLKRSYADTEPTEDSAPVVKKSNATSSVSTNTVDNPSNTNEIDPVEHEIDIMDMDTDVTDEMLWVYDNVIKTEEEASVATRRTDKNSLEKNIYSAILKYIENETGKKIRIISYGNMSQNEWVVLGNKNTESHHTIVLCITFYDGQSFSISSAKNGGKADPNKDKYYSVVYRFIEQDAIELPVATQEAAPQKEKLSQAGPKLCNKTKETISTVDSSIEVVIEEDLTSNDVSIPDSTFNIKTVVQSDNVPKSKSTPHSNNQISAVNNISDQTVHQRSNTSMQLSSFRNINGFRDRENETSPKNSHAEHLKQSINTKLKSLREAAMRGSNLMSENNNSHTTTPNVSSSSNHQTPISVSDPRTYQRHACDSRHRDKPNLVGNSRNHLTPRPDNFSRNYETSKAVNNSRNYETPKPVSNSSNFQKPKPVSDSRSHQMPIRANDSRNQVTSNLFDNPRNHPSPIRVGVSTNYPTFKPICNSRNYETLIPVSNYSRNYQTPKSSNNSRNQENAKPDSNPRNQQTPKPDSNLRNQQTSKLDSNPRNQQTPKPDNNLRNQQTPKPDGNPRNQQTPKPDSNPRNHDTPMSASSSRNQPLPNTGVIRRTDGKSLPLIPVQLLANPPGPNNCSKNSGNSRDIITVVDRRPNKRNGRSKKIKNNLVRLFRAKKRREINSDKVYATFIKNISDVSPDQNKQNLAQFVRTEKKQLSSLPTVTVREHVPLEVDEDEQVLPVSDDDVLIVEIENKPIEID